MLFRTRVTDLRGLNIAGLFGIITNRLYRSRGGLWMQSFFVPHHNNVLALVGHANGEQEAILGANIVTNDGDLYYAQQGASETPTNDFGAATSIQEVATAGTPGKAAIRSSFTNVAASQKIHDGTYPQTNDGDGDNTGAGTDIVTYRTSWTTGDFNQTGITHGIITTTAPAAGAAILTGYAFAASFDKTASDTLKNFVNHTMNGV